MERLKRLEQDFQQALNLAVEKGDNLKATIANAKMNIIKVVYELPDVIRGEINNKLRKEKMHG